MMYSVWYSLTGNTDAGRGELVAEDEDVAWVVAYARRVAKTAPQGSTVVIATCQETEYTMTDQPIVKIKGSSI
jgi:hypothetical protein